MSEQRRKYNRVPFEQERLTLLWLEGCYEVVACDLSAGGVAVTMPEAIPEGERVVIELDDAESVPADVCYCQPEGDGEYRVGLRFAGVEK